MMSTRHAKTETGADLMFRAAQRARTRPPFMAWLLARAQAQQGARRRNSPLNSGYRRTSCPAWRSASSPRPDHFAEDLAGIAARMGCPPAALATLVHRASADEPPNG